MARSADKLLELFARKPVVNLPEIQAALGGVCAMSAFRYLRMVSYRRSYNRNGAFYCLHDPSRYDRLGLWSLEGIRFSVDGSLRSTVQRLVQEAAPGATQRELSDWLRVRVQNTLLGLVRDGQLSRELVEALYVYLHADPSVAKEQLSRRRAELAAGRVQEPGQADLPAEAAIIQILLALIRHPGQGAGDVARRLRGHAPPIPLRQVQAVFSRYGLDEKGGPSRR